MVILVSHISHVVEPLDMVSLKPFKILFKSDQDGAMVKRNYNKLNKITLDKMGRQSLESNINQEEYSIKI